MISSFGALSADGLGLPPDDPLSPADFRRLADYIRAASGIHLTSAKRTMIEGRLRRRVRALGCGTLADYCTWLFDQGHLADDTEWLLNAVTTNKTDFFREPRHFAYLVEEVLPRWRDAGAKRVRIWSTACSTGPEAYTLAMLLDAFAQDQGGPDYAILATDLDTEVLEIARRGVYPGALFDPVPPPLRERYSLPARDPRRDERRIVPALRAAIGFARLNLIDSHYPIGAPMDLIFCRNVLIYFDKETQAQVVRRLARCLAPGGLLILGHSETIAGLGLEDALVAVSNTVFRRV